MQKHLKYVHTLTNFEKAFYYNMYKTTDINDSFHGCNGLAT